MKIGERTFPLEDRNIKFSDERLGFRFSSSKCVTCHLAKSWRCGISITSAEHLLDRESCSLWVTVANPIRVRLHFTMLTKSKPESKGRPQVFASLHIKNITPNYPEDVLQMFDKVNMTITRRASSSFSPFFGHRRSEPRIAGGGAPLLLLVLLLSVVRQQPASPPPRRAAAGNERVRAGKGLLRCFGGDGPPRDQRERE